MDSFDARRPDGNQLPITGLVLLNGPNFSGRTACLENMTGYGHEAMPSVDTKILIGTEVYNTISGLALTVLSELELHNRANLEPSVFHKLVVDFGLAELLDANPFKLSGGEQVCLAIASKVLLGPKVIALDCVFEQLHEERRDCLLRSFKSLDEGILGVVVDNRPEDFYPGFWTTILDIKDLHNDPQHHSSMLGTPSADPLEDLKSVEGSHISVQDIKQQYGKRTVLNGLTADLYPGKVYHLEGRNGAGKSTFAKLLAGTIKIASGTISRDGNLIRPEKYRGELVSYHFQHPDLQLFCQSVKEELYSSGKGDPDRVQLLIDAFDLGSVLTEHPLDLPFVIRKRVALAASLSSPSPWHILDEPTLGQDRKTAESIASMIKCLASKGHGVIVISHSSWFRRQVSGQRLLLEDGRIQEAE